MEVINLKKDFGVKTWLYPMPVLMIATYNEDGSPNVMNAAWGGTGGEELFTVCIPLGETAWCHKRHASWCERGSCNAPYSIALGGPRLSRPCPIERHRRAKYPRRPRRVALNGMPPVFYVP